MEGSLMGLKGDREEGEGHEETRGNSEYLG